MCFLPLFLRMFLLFSSVFASLYSSKVLVVSDRVSTILHFVSVTSQPNCTHNITSSQRTYWLIHVHLNFPSSHSYTALTEKNKTHDEISLYIWVFGFTRKCLFSAWVGGDEWIRLQFHLYLVSLLATVQSDSEYHYTSLDIWQWGTVQGSPPFGNTLKHLSF